jgi:hypothetical protein
MRHERIPIEAKMAKDAAKCRPCTPAYDNAIMGIPQRTGTEQQQGVGNTPSTSAATTPAAVAGGDGDVNGSNGSEMDWLVMGGGLDDPLTSLLVRDSHKLGLLYLMMNPPPQTTMRESLSRRMRVQQRC